MKEGIVRFTGQPSTCYQWKASKLAAWHWTCLSFVARLSACLSFLKCFNETVALFVHRFLFVFPSVNVTNSKYPSLPALYAKMSFAIVFSSDASKVLLIFYSKLFVLRIAWRWTLIIVHVSFVWGPGTFTICLYSVAYSFVVGHAAKRKKTAKLKTSRRH